MLRSSLSVLSWYLCVQTDERTGPFSTEEWRRVSTLLQRTRTDCSMCQSSLWRCSQWALLGNIFACRHALFLNCAALYFLCVRVVDWGMCDTQCWIDIKTDRYFIKEKLGSNEQIAQSCKFLQAFGSILFALFAALHRMLHLAIIHEEEVIAQQLIQLFPKEVLDIQNNLYQVSVEIVALLIPSVCDFLRISVFDCRGSALPENSCSSLFSGLPSLPSLPNPLPSPTPHQGSHCQQRLIRDFEWKLPSSTSCRNRSTVLVHPCMDVGGSEQFQSNKAVRLSCTWSRLTRRWWLRGLRVGVGFGGDETHSVKEKRLKRRVSILLIDSVVPIFGVTSHSEISHLDVKSVFFLFFFKNRKSTYTCLLFWLRSQLKMMHLCSSFLQLHHVLIWKLVKV